MVAALSGGFQRARPGPGARRLHRSAADRRRPPVRRELGPGPAVPAGGAVPGARVSVHLSRSDQHRDLGRAGAGHARSHRHQAPHQHVRSGANHLHGWPPASAGVRGAHVDGLLDRPVAGQHARGHDHAHQEGLAAAERRAGERSRDAHGVLRAQRRGDDAHQRDRGSRIPHGAAGEERGVRSQHAGRPASGVAVQVQAGGRGGAARGRRPALPAGHEHVRRGIPQALQLSGIHHPRRRGADVSARFRAVRSRAGDEGPGPRDAGGWRGEGPAHPGAGLHARLHRGQHGGACRAGRCARRRHAAPIAVETGARRHPRHLRQADSLHRRYAGGRGPHRRERSAR